MMIKHYDDTYIVDDINNLPIEKLKLSDKVMLFDKGYISKYDRFKSDACVSMVLTEIRDRLYIFDCFALQTMIRRIDDEEELISAEFNHHSYYMSYLLVESGKFIELKAENSLDRMYELKFEEDYGEDYDDLNSPYGLFLSKMNEILFQNDNNINFKKHKFSFDESLFITFPVELSKDEYLVFLIHHTIQPNCKYWYSYHQVLYFNRNSTIYSVGCDFVDLYDNISKLYQNDKFGEFSNSIKVMNYEMRNYLYGANPEADIQLVASELDVNINDIKKFLEPIYVSKNQELEAYSDSLKSFSHGLLYKYNKRDNFFDSDGGETEDLKIEKKIATAVYVFKNAQSFTGLSPIDGKIYKHGKIDESAMNDIDFYVDSLGVIAQIDGQMRYFANLKGYYVPLSNNFDDRKVISELERNRNMVDVLMKDPV